MILVSSFGHKYEDFNWKLYSNMYEQLKKEGFDTSEKLWWHFLNIGEKNGYKFFNIKEYQLYLDKYSKFDDYSYSVFMDRMYSIDLKKNGIITKEQIWWHHIVKNDEKNYFKISDRNKNLIHLFAKDSEPKKTIYYFIHHTCSNPIRTGIQIVTIYLAKELLKIKYKNKYDFELVFVKWSDIYQSLVKCNKKDMDNLFYLNEDEVADKEPFHYECTEEDSSYPIHTNYTSFKNSVFFCPEIIFVIDLKLPLLIKKYLNEYELKSICILYDIIPLRLEEYSFIKNDYKQYFDNTILNANKIITISNFTKDEFLRYSVQNKLIKSNFPEVKSVLLPCQYRSKPFTKSKHQCKKKKVTILVAGTVEPRKQQVRLLKIFNDFLEKNPKIDVELIVFGRVIKVCENDFFKEINRSNGKIKYLDVIDNEQLFELYKKSSFSCFISKYEGFGFPISESIWHGTPVLTSNYGAMKEVTDFGGCYAIDTTNDVEIYNALDKMISDRKLIRSLKNQIDEIKLTTWSSYAEDFFKNIF